MKEELIDGAPAGSIVACHPSGWIQTGIFTKLFDFFFTVVPCILILSKSFIYQLMHNRVALKEY